MKKAISLLAAFALLCSLWSVGVYADAGVTYYIDSVAGDDAASGTSAAAPWKTVAGLEGLTLNPGDAVLFKRGGIFTVDCLTLTADGTAENPIVLGAYGEGALPLLTTAGSSEILRLFDCSYITVQNLEMTAPNGGGIWINTQSKASEGITLESLKIHNIQNHTVTSRDSQRSAAAARACVMLKCLAYPSPSVYPVNNFTCRNCEMFDCGNGLLMWGAFAPDSTSPWADIEDNDIKMIYNQGALVEGCYFHDMDAEAMIIGITENALVTDCRIIDCCQGVGTDENGQALYYTAPIWYWGGLNSTVEHCEVAGAKNHGDGMTCDFDSWTNYCTYQYIYSHDNNAFVNNNPYGIGQWGNTVRYCLSVNDNGIRNAMAVRKNEYDFKFYNNTLVNAPNMLLKYLNNGFVANNIFVGSISSDWYWATKDETFSGIFTNNCIWGMGAPGCSENTFCCDPLFTGTDVTNPESYRLSAASPLLGKGVAVNDGLTEDFYGNSLGDTVNIGCYGGEGEGSAAFAPLSFITHLFGTLLGSLYQTISDLVNAKL